MFLHRILLEWFDVVLREFPLMDKFLVPKINIAFPSHVCSHQPLMCFPSFDSITPFLDPIWFTCYSGILFISVHCYKLPLYTYFFPSLLTHHCKSYTLYCLYQLDTEYLRTRCGTGARLSCSCLIPCRLSTCRIPD